MEGLMEGWKEEPVRRVWVGGNELLDLGLDVGVLVYRCIGVPV